MVREREKYTNRREGSAEEIGEGWKDRNLTGKIEMRCERRQQIEK